jgi:hypothetical protein
MIRPPSFRSTATTLAAAAVLVGGADLASYAATGHPLILGHANSAVGTTSLKNVGRGPALSLNSIKSSPPLVVNSSKVVKHLNAAQLQGRSASKLDPPVWRYTLGRTGHRLSAAEHLFTARVPKGTYQMAVSGLAMDTDTTDEFDCVIANKVKVVNNGDESGLYPFHLATFDGSDPNGAIIDASDIETLNKATVLIFGCETQNTTGTITLIRPVTFTWRQVPVNDKRGKPFTGSPRNGGRVGLLHR